MNKIIKNNFLITALLVFGCFATTSVISQAMDSSFSYQGELLDNGVPANGQYDINIDLIDGDLFAWGSTSVHSPVQVVNGLFSVNADFGISSFNGYNDFTITVSVRKTSEGPGGAFTTLGSQTVQAVPMATNLTNGSATVGQVLTFNGFQWNPADPASGSSPWTVAGSEINFMDNVGIGIADPSTRLHVVSSSAVPIRIEGGNDMYISFYESGNYRGYIGSYTSATGTSDEDFDIGTGFLSTGSLQFSTSLVPRMTITSGGKVGIGDTAPLADLHIESTTDGDVLRVRVDDSTKLYVDDNGGTSVGSWDTPPTNGLKVNGDVKQPIASNGMMKYMVYATCSTSGANIIRSYNGVNSSAITIANGSSGDSLCVIDFPNNIDDRFWQVSPVIGSKDRGAHCTISGLDKLSCFRYTTSTGANNAGDIMVLVY